jgi:hypothetical protein
MERAIPHPPASQPADERRHPLSPQEILAAAAMLAQVERLSPEQARADLEILDQACLNLYGPGYTAWAEYYEYKAILESFARGRDG